MKRIKMKSNFVLMVLGMIIGFIISIIIEQLAMKYIFMFIALLFLMIISLTWIITDNFDLKITNAYEKRIKSAKYLPPKHVNCRCGPNPYADEDKGSI